MRARTLLIGLWIGTLLGFPTGASGQPAPVEEGTLQVRVVLIGPDLSLRPVPKQRFAILRADESVALEPSTGFDGGIETTLAAGSYRIRSLEPVSFDGRSFTWDEPFEVVPGGVTVLELSNDNATTTARAEVTTEGEIYETYSGGVFKVLSESGHGTGFLVGEEGLVLTNHHVVADSGYLAVECDTEHKYAAELLATDEPSDLAVLRVHPESIAGLPTLPLADETPDRPAVAVGDRVLAIGNPLSTETILTSGLVSKVEADSIYSDVDIDEGNSGGPLIDLRGRVVGITTFGVSGDQGNGLSGIVRLHRALPLIESSRRKLADGEPPSPRMLPTASTFRFTPDKVKDDVLARERNIEDYAFEAGKIDVQFMTPTLLASLIVQQEQEAARGREKRQKKQARKQGKKPSEMPTEAEYEPGQAFYDWQKHAENFVPVVRVRARPEVKMKIGSAFKSGLVGGGVKYRFKTDFERMELLRDGEPVEPIHPGKIKQVVHIEGAASMKDIGTFGLYQYPPEAFRPGSRLTLRIWEQGVDEPFEQVLTPTLLLAIQRDFEGFYAWQDEVAAER